METQNVLRLVDQLEMTVENGKRFLGKCYVDEVDFFTYVQLLRSGLPPALRLLNDADRDEVLKPIADVEELVEQGPGMMGKKGISEETFFALMQQFRANLHKAMLKAEGIAKQVEVPAGPANGTRQIGFDELLRDGKRIFDEVERGESFSVVREGRVVARLTPPL